MKRFNAFELDDIASRYEKGETSVSIGQVYGVDYSLILTVLRMMGVEIRKAGPLPKGDRFSPEEKLRIIDLYTSGSSLPAIAHEMHSDTYIVRQAIVEQGIPIRPKGRIPGDCFPLERKQRNALNRYPGIDKLLGDHRWTLEAIGQKYGITRERARQFGVMFGVPPRMPILIEAGKIKKQIRQLGQRERKKARKQRWVDIAGRLSLLIESGCSRAELIDAMPWKIQPWAKTPVNQRLSINLFRLRKLSGVVIPKPHFLFSGGVPVGTKRK